MYVRGDTSWKIYWRVLAALGVKQVKLLPTHMLIEFFRRGNLKSDSDFNVESNHYYEVTIGLHPAGGSYAIRTIKCCCLPQQNFLAYHVVGIRSLYILQGRT